MTNYFRITGYHPDQDFSFILDSSGMFEQIWQFSSMLVLKGFKVLEVSNANSFLDVNIEKAPTDKEHIFLRATCEGKPQYIEKEIAGKTHKCVQVADKIYIPKKENAQ